MNRKFSLLFLISTVSFLISCKKETVEMNSSFYAMDTASLDKNGVWQYSTSERYYDSDKSCFANRLDLDAIQPKEKAVSEPTENITWKVYVGKINRGVSYGFIASQPHKEIAYQNKEWFLMPQGSLDNLKKIFERDCLIEKAN